MPYSSAGRLAADSFAGVGEVGALDRKKLPFVAIFKKSEADHTIGFARAQLAVRAATADPAQLSSARADDELPYAAPRVCVAFRVLWSEALVVVFVSANVKLNTGVIERLEQWSDALVAAMMPGAKQGVMRVGQDTFVVRLLEILDEPTVLLGVLVATADLLAKGIKRDGVFS